MIIYDNINILLSCGNNQYGQLGLGHLDDTLTFTKLIDNGFHINDKNIIEINCGYQHSVALSETGLI